MVQSSSFNSHMLTVSNRSRESHVRSIAIGTESNKNVDVLINGKHRFTGAILCKYIVQFVPGFHSLGIAKRMVAPRVVGIVVWVLIVFLKHSSAPGCQMTVPR